MATITGLTAARMLEIEAASIVDGDIVGDDLFLTKHDGSVVNAGNVRGPQGVAGPMGHPLSVVSAAPVYDVGVANQIRAGRQLAPTDFTNMGLSVPLGLWNLSSFTDASGNGRNLTNKGSVPFGVGINGAASTAAVFSGSTGQAFYIPEATYPGVFQIKTGSWGGWFKTAKRGVYQDIISKRLTSTQMQMALNVNTSNTMNGFVCIDGVTVSVVAATTSDVADDRWHFSVMTYDGTFIRMYVDGVLEAKTILVGTAFASTAPLNIGGFGADASTAASEPFYGRLDEVFITSDVLSEEEIHNLYCARIVHSLGAVPVQVPLSVRRKRRGATLAVGDFPSQPVRLYNFTAGALTDEGSNNVPLVAQGTTTGIFDVIGADGLGGNGKNLGGAHQGFGATDTGLPAGTSARSFGGWFKTVPSAASQVLINWGTITTADARVYLSGPASSGVITSTNGADSMAAINLCDWVWHQFVVVEDNAAADGVKRKLYVDGRLLSGSTVLNAITLAGANKLRIGAHNDGTSPFLGLIDGFFIFAGALTGDQIRVLYNKGSQQLAPSLKDEADHIDAVSATDMLVTFDSLEYSDLVDLGAAA